MNIVAILAQKGGAGKTTLAISLAVAAQMAGRTAAVIDLDPQATAANWSDRRQNQPPVVVSAQAARLVQVLRTAEAGGAQFIVIDTPPRAEQAAIGAAGLASLVLIPCRPAAFDLDTVATTLGLVRLAGHSGHVAAILNGVAPAGVEREHAASILVDAGLTVCPAALGYRKAFAHSGAVGQAAQEFEPSGKAADEIRQVYKFVCKLLNK